MSAAETMKRKRAQPSAETRLETHVSSDWGSLLKARQAPITARTAGSGKIWLVDELLSKDECAQLLSRAEAHGFGTTHYEHSYRGNLRLTTTDASLAEAVWARLRAVVPTRLTLTKPDCEAGRSDYWWDHYPDAEGVWEAYGLNECWRLAKYRPGDRFLFVCDEAYVSKPRAAAHPAEARMSMLSVNIYMNGGFEGGRTRFFLRVRQLVTRRLGRPLPAEVPRAKNPTPPHRPESCRAATLAHTGLALGVAKGAAALCTAPLPDSVSAPLVTSRTTGGHSSRACRPVP